MNSNLPKRPISPHLQIYKPQITSALSIFHRITGFVLSLGLVLFAIWLYAAEYDAELLNSVHNFAGSWIGMLLLFGWSFAFYYHMANGIRHLIWDSGRMLEISDATKGGFVVLGFTIGSTISSWIYILMEIKQ